MSTIRPDGRNQPACPVCKPLRFPFVKRRLDFGSLSLNALEAETGFAQGVADERFLIVPDLSLLIYFAD